MKEPSRCPHYNKAYNLPYNKEKMIKSEEALKIISLAHKKALELNVKCTVTVVDVSGRLVASVRSDGAGFLTPDTSKAKAVASVAYKKSTKELVELQKTNPSFWNAVPALFEGKVLPATGAVPIIKDNEIIGALGVGGGTPEQDHEIAIAGLNGLS
jgi:uncharacterized protein GlcG (DUF336 family)